jgi:hypothetical protein
MEALSWFRQEMARLLAVHRDADDGSGGEAAATARIVISGCGTSGRVVRDEERAEME